MNGQVICSRLPYQVHTQEYHPPKTHAKENYKSLKNQIHRAITSGSAKLYKIEKNEYNIIKFEYHVEVTGLNGNKATIVAVYGIGPKQGKPKMITNYIK